VKPRVEGYLAAVLEPLTPDQLREVADELDAVDHLIETHDELRVGLTDTAVPAIARRRVVDEVLTGRVSDATRRVAVFIAGEVFAPEVPSGVLWACQQARRLAEGRALTYLILGHLAARSRVGGYATAVFEDLSMSQLEDVEDEVFRFARTVEAVPALRLALSDREIDVNARKAIVTDLTRGKVTAATSRLIGFTLEGGRARDLVGTLDYIVESAAAARGWRVARVRAGRPIDDGQRARLSSSLADISGHNVELQITVDPQLLGGALVQIGDLQVDATARGRLDNLREHLLGQEWHARMDLTGGENPETQGSS
jgi:F-type H+-transporting ATPase subunit delta